MPGDNRYGWQGAGRTDLNPATEQGYAPATRMIGPVKAITPLPVAPIFAGPVSVGADTGCTNAIFRVSGNVNITQRIGVGVCSPLTTAGVTIAGDCSPDLTLSSTRTLGTATVLWNNVYAGGFTGPNVQLDNGTSTIVLNGVAGVQTPASNQIFGATGNIRVDTRGGLIITASNNGLAGRSVIQISVGNPPSGPVFQITDGGNTSILGSLGVSGQTVLNPTTNVLDVRTGNAGSWGNYAFIGTSTNVADQGGLLMGNAFTNVAGNFGWKISSTFSASPSHRMRMGWVDLSATETYTTGTASIEVRPEGGIGFYAAASTNAILNIQGTMPSTFSNADERGMTIDFQSNIAATTSTQALIIRSGTSPNAYTSAQVNGIHIFQPVLGAGSTITAANAILIDQMTNAATNCGINIQQSASMTAISINQAAAQTLQALLITGGTATASATTINGTFFQFNQTWNGTGVYKAMYVAITNTASGAGSTFLTYTNTVQNVLVIGVNGDFTLTPPIGSGVTAFTLTGANNANLMNLTAGANGAGINLTMGTSGTGLAITQPSGAGTAIQVSGGTLTGAATNALLNLAQTWNTTGTPTAILMNVTNTASGANSLLMSLQLSGGHLLDLDIKGNLTLNGAGLATGGTFTATVVSLQGGISAGINVVQSTGSLGPAFQVLLGTISGAAGGQILSLAQTWNTTGAPTAILVNITNTASAATAKLIDLQVGGASQFSVDVTGNATILGRAGVGTAPATDRHLYIAGNILTGGATTQSGIVLNPQMQNTATVEFSALRAQFTTPASVFTMANGYILHVQAPSLGAGSVVTTLVGLKIDNLTTGGSNFAIQTGTGVVQFGDAVKSTAAIANALDLSAGPGNIAFGSKSFTISVAGTTTPVGNARYTVLNFTVAVTQTIAAPSPACGTGGIMIFEIFGNGVAPGVITWNGVYHFAAGTAPTNPALGKRRYVAFICADGTNFYELYRSTGDI